MTKDHLMNYLYGGKWTEENMRLMDLSGKIYEDIEDDWKDFSTDLDILYNEIYEESRNGRKLTDEEAAYNTIVYYYNYLERIEYLLILAKKIYQKGKITYLTSQEEKILKTFGKYLARTFFRILAAY